MKRLIPVFVAILALCVFGFQFHRHMDDPIRGDEAAWIFSTVYLSNYVKGEWNHQNWDSLDAIDHPPVGKYYYGIATWLAGGKWFDTADKEWWFEHSADEFEADEFQFEMSRRVPKRVLLACRAAAALSAFAACMGLYALCAWLIGPALGTRAAVAFVLLRLVLYYVPIVEADFLWMALCLWQAAFLVRWMKSPSWTGALVQALLLGLLIDTRLTGIVQIPVVALGAAFAVMSFRGRRCQVASQFVVILLAAVVVTVLLNPAFLRSSGTLWSMFEHRGVQLAAATLFSGMKHISSIFPAVKGMQHLIGDFGLPIDSVKFSFGLFMATVGAVGVLNYLLGPGHAGWLSEGPIWTVLLMAKFWFGMALWSFSRTLWLRYLLPAEPFFAILIACGVVFIWRAVAMLKKVGWAEYREKARVPILGFILFLAIWLGPATMSVDGELVAAMNGADVQKERLELILRRHPEALEPRLDLAELYIRSGDYKNASKVFEPVVFLQPGNKTLKALSEVLSDQAGGRQ